MKRCYIPNYRVADRTGITVSVIGKLRHRNGLLIEGPTEEIIFVRLRLVTTKLADGSYTYRIMIDSSLTEITIVL